MSTARFDTLTNRLGTKSVPVDTVVDGSLKAWVNFNGSGTVAIRAAFNVSSIVDVGVGSYRVNFATPMPDADYGILATTRTNIPNQVDVYQDGLLAPTINAAQLAVVIPPSTAADASLITAAFTR